MRLSPILTILALAQPVLASDDPVPRGATESGTVVSHVSGEVVRFVQEAAFRNLVLGQDLLGGDTVRTGERGVVGILFVDGTVMRLHPHTELLVKQVGRKAELELRTGTIWARAPRGRSDLTVYTPAAAAGIRGTDWTLSVEGGGVTRLVVYDGAVELSNAQGSLLSNKGQAALAVPGRAPVRVGVANRREAAQMLYTLAPTGAADIMVRAGGQTGGGNPAALSEYRRGLALLRSGDPAAADVLDAAAPGLGKEDAAAARWLAAFARAEAGASLRVPPSGGAVNDVIGAAFAAAMSGDLDRAQAILDRMPGQPVVDAAAVQVAILRDDAPRARAILDRLRQAAPGSVPALEAEASFASAVEGDHARARALLMRAVALAPDDATLWNDLGLEEAALDHLLEAETAYRSALAIAPNDPAALGNLATLLLDEERVDEARAIAEGMLARDPGSYLGLRALGRAQLQAGDPGAEDTLLKALAAQPAAAETSIALAIAAQQTGDRVRARQELDAAARLDPNDPVVPEIRSIVALDENRVDDAIIAAREAAALLRRQDTTPRVVAADRNTGSPLSAAYTAIGLDGWARYTADRTFDPLSAASLFTEGSLVRTTIGRSGPSSDGEDGAFVNGLLLEPLAASYRLRWTDILRRPFLDTGVSVTTDESGPVDGGLQVEGLVRVPAPLAFSLNLSDTSLQGNFTDGDLKSGNLFLGTQFGARASVFGIASHDETDSDYARPYGFGLTNRNNLDVSGDSFAVGGSLRLIDRTFLTLFASRRTQQTHQDVVRNAVDLTTPSAIQLAARSDQKVTAEGLSLGLQSEDDRGYWTVGIEGGRLHEQSNSTLALTDLLTGGSSTIVQATDGRTRTSRWYAGRRQRLSPTLAAETLVTLDRVSGEDRLGGRLALAWTPAPGQWLRGEIFSDGRPQAPSLAPATALGLVPVQLPYAAEGEVSGAILRYDAEINERWLVGIEHQQLRPRGLVYGTENPLASLDVDSANLAVTSLRADWWIGNGMGLTGVLTNADSSIRGGTYNGEALPDVPDWTAQLGFGWLAPNGFSGSVSAVWTSSQFSGVPGKTLPPVLTVDAGFGWESRDKRFSARLDAVNLFDDEVLQAFDAAPLRRQVLLTLTARF